MRKEETVFESLMKKVETIPYENIDISWWSDIKHVSECKVYFDCSSDTGVVISDNIKYSTFPKYVVKAYKDNKKVCEFEFRNGNSLVESFINKMNHYLREEIISKKESEKKIFLNKKEKKKNNKKYRELRALEEIIQ